MTRNSDLDLRDLFECTHVPETPIINAQLAHERRLALLASQYDMARVSFSERDCAKLLGVMIGMLVDMAPLENVRAAVKWWAENDNPWADLEADGVRCLCGHGAEAHANQATECNGIGCCCARFLLDHESVLPK